MSTTHVGARASGLPSVGDLPWGSHVGVFYSDPGELLDVLVPFVRAGLEHHELCSWEVHPPLSVEEVTAALAGGVPDFSRYVALGQMEIVPPSGERPVPARAGELLEGQLDRAILAGFEGFRVVAEPGRSSYGSAAESVGWLNVIAAFPYPRAELGVVDLLDRVQDHRLALVSNSGGWDVLEGAQARTRRDALKRSEDRLQSLFRNMSEGFAYNRIVRDPRGTPCDFVFLDVNPAFERLTGLAAEDVIGRRATQVVPGIENDPADWIGKYARVALTGEPLQFESHSAALDRWYAVSAFSSQRGYFAATFADVTDRRRAQRERDEALQRLQETHRRKDEFLAVLSHELRNPLAPIQNCLYILDRAAPGGEQARRSLEVIRRQTGHLARLVDDLLDVTRIARGKIRLQRELVDVVDLVHRTVEDYRASFGESGVRLDARLPDDAIWADADPTRLAQIVGNLLGNALKFTPRGGAVELRLRSEEGAATLRVRDSGVGIAPDVIERLFQPFAQAEQTLDRSRGGLGLGLALVKGLAELHGGSAAAASEGLGHGSEFTVKLPLGAAPQPPSPARPARRASPRRVLVVEDNTDAADSVKELLESWGHEVRIARDGPAGIAVAREFRPELVLCDIGLPGMSGYAVARALRADASIGTPCLVALTGYASPEDVRCAKEAGFDRHLAKPPQLEALEELLSLRGQEAPLRVVRGG